MYRSVLLLLAAFYLFTAADCEDCAPLPPVLIGSLEVILESTLPDSASYVVGDTVWFSAAFSREREANDGAFMISEEGGLVASQVYRLVADTLLQPAQEEVRVMEDLGVVQRDAGSDPTSTRVLRYRCDQNECRFRQGYVLLQPGTFLLRVVGSSIIPPAGEIGGSCSSADLAPTLEDTRLIGARSPESLDLNDRTLDELLRGAFFFNPRSLESVALLVVE